MDAPTPPPAPRPSRIVSGGQTGVDRAALDVALELGLPIGGWVPAGRRAEDGPIPARYVGLIETTSRDYAVRTRRNVRDSDGTLILTEGAPSGGTALTVRAAERAGRPLRVVDLASTTDSQAAAAIRRWIEAADVDVLNVAGPRASGAPGLSARVHAVLTLVLGDAGSLSGS